MNASRPLRIVVVCPHFRPDSAPTGVVMTRIVDELIGLGHHVDVVTSLPWYRRHSIEPGWTGRWVRRERTDLGAIVRVTPFPGSDKSNLLRRAAGFLGFSLLTGVASGLTSSRADVLLVMSPPLTLGVSTKLFNLATPMIFNVQDVFPDAAEATGAITNRRVLRLARLLERASYRLSAAVTVLSEDLATNVRGKVPSRHARRVHVIPNFVDTEAITPLPRSTAYRRDHGIGDELVVMYAGNVGFSQSLELLLGAARVMPQVTFVVNGDGSARETLRGQAEELGNVRFVGYQPVERLAEILSSADLHVVPLRRGLGSVSVPSKTYSVMAAGRAVLASIDADTEVPRMLAASGGGRTVAPDDQRAFNEALTEMLADPQELAAMGRRARAWVLSAASPRAVAVAYERLIRTIVPS